MAFKFVLLCAILSFARAVPVLHHEGILVSGHDDDHGHDHYAPAEYKFEYAVHDAHTGDIKSQEETRHGDVVHGSYSLVEPDGHKRVVHYTADHHNGFNAVVHREGTVHHVPAAHHAPIAVAHHAPIAVAHHAQPLAIAAHHVAPVVVAHHAAPVHGHVATSHANIQIAHHAGHLGDYHY